MGNVYRTCMRRIDLRRKHVVFEAESQLTPVHGTVTGVYSCNVYGIDRELSCMVTC